MTRVVFFRRGSDVTGFRITGHCTRDENDTVGKLCCAAVSSAAYMAANTVTEIDRVAAEVSVDDAQMSLSLPKGCTDCQSVLRGFELHITELSKQYPDHLRIKTEAD